MRENTAEEILERYQTKGVPPDQLSVVKGRDGQTYVKREKPSGETILTPVGEPKTDNGQ